MASLLYILNIHNFNRYYYLVISYLIHFFPEKEALNKLVKTLAGNFSKSFDSKLLERLARQTGFVQRSSKLKAHEFLAGLLFARLDGDQLSLRDLSDELDAKLGVDITKQSLDQQFNEKSVLFLKQLIAAKLKDQLTGAVCENFLPAFSSIDIQDSTAFQLPAHLAPHYGGVGGMSSGSMARIQFEYDLKAGQIKTLALTPGQMQDIDYVKQNLDKLTAGALIIRDLGYVSRAVLKLIADSGAYFLCRLRPNQGVYTGQDGQLVPLDFASLKGKLQKVGLPYYEQQVYLGDKTPLPVRLHVAAIPDQVAEKRLRKAQKEAKKQGYALGQRYKGRVGLNIFITNAGQQQLPAEHLRKVYGLRWQIELIFKVWKPTLAIAKVKKIKKARLECQLLARLLLVVVGWQLFRGIEKHLYSQTGSFLSMQKFFKTLKYRLESLAQAMAQSYRALEVFMQKLIKACTRKHHRLEKKKRKLAYYEVISILSFNYQLTNENMYQ